MNSTEKKLDHLSRAVAHMAERLGHEFKQTGLLDQALTHSSLANENGLGDYHNERQEFLGDAVLELCISQQLYRRFPKMREGVLTRMRSSMVSEESLAQCARELCLDDFLKLGHGEEMQGGRKRNSILADCLEAVLAAIYEDGGLASAEMAVARIFEGHWPVMANVCQVRDSKSLLQEHCQKHFRNMPSYSLSASLGPEHAKSFAVLLTLPDGLTVEGRGSSRKKAEQDAASQALAILKQKN